MSFKYGVNILSYDLFVSGERSPNISILRHGKRSKQYCPPVPSKPLDWLMAQPHFCSDQSASFWALLLPNHAWELWFSAPPRSSRFYFCITPGWTRITFFDALHNWMHFSASQPNNKMHSYELKCLGWRTDQTARLHQTQGESWVLFRVENPCFEPGQLARRGTGNSSRSYRIPLRPFRR